MSALREEMSANLRLALPLVLAQMSFVSMGAVDTIIAGRLGATPLAAVAVGATIWFMVFVLFLGLFNACSPLVAQRHGAGRGEHEVGDFVRGALVLAALLGLVWVALLLAAAAWLPYHLGLDLNTADAARAYLCAIAPGGLPFTLFFALRNCADGWGQTRATLFTGVTGFGVNAVVAYGLANGRWGLPALGATGCGIATAFAGAVMAAGYAALYLWWAPLRGLGLFRPGARWRPGFTGEIFALGGPIALIVTAEAWLFQFGALMMARFGAQTVAAHQIAINFAALSFMVPLSLGMSTAVRVGRAHGAGDAAAVRLRGITGLWLGAGYALFSASLMALAPEPIAGAYTLTPEVRTLAASFLRYAALFQIFDCLQATAAGALRGVSDTRVPMLITVAAYWLVGLPLAVSLAFETPVGPPGVWLGFTGGLAMAAGGLCWRFLHYTRNHSGPIGSELRS